MPVREKGRKDKKEEKEEELLNANFVQLNKTNLVEWRKLIRSSPVAVEIMYFFFEKMGKDNAVVCSYKTLEEITSTSRATVGRAIKALRDGKWLQTVKLGSATAYVVNEQVAWQTHASKRQYAIFRAVVVATDSENKEIKEVSDSTKLRRVPIVMREEQERGLISNEELPPPDQNELDLN